MTYITLGHRLDLSRADATFSMTTSRRPFNIPSLDYSSSSANGGERKIACCTPEMITLIFLLFVSLNGGLDDLNTSKVDLEPRSETELVSAWGEPDNVVLANELGFVSSQLEAVEIWSYGNPLRFVLVRDNIVVSIQEGRRGLGAVTACYSSLIRCVKCRVAFLNSALARHPRTTGSAG